MNKLKSFFKENGLIYAIASGVLFATSYPPFPAWALFISLVPLWLFWYRAQSIRQVLVSGFVCQFVYLMIGFNWISHVAQEFGHMPLAVSLLVQFLFNCTGHLNTVLAGGIVYSLHKRFNLKPFGFFTLTAATYSSLEIFWPHIFPFNYGYPLYYSGFNTAQLAEYVGFWGLSFLVLLANAMVAIAAVQYKKPGWFRPIIGVFTGLLVFEILGSLTVSRLPIEDKAARVLIVQPNVGNFEKHYATYGPRYQEPVTDRLFSVTREGLASQSIKPDLIVWPETAYPQTMDPWFSSHPIHQKLVDFAKNTGGSFIFGAYSDDPPSQLRPRSFNAVFGFDNGNLVEAKYRKHILLAFGEYFPGAQYFPFVLQLIPEISNFGRGEGPVLFNVGGIKYVPLICYEILDSPYVGRALATGAQAIINVTNDSWFGTHFEPYQHLYMGAARSIEYRTPVVRATNTGISALIDSRGRILMRGPQNEEWAQTGTLPYYSTPSQTFYSKIDTLLPWIILMIAFIIGFLAVRSSNGKVRT